MTKRGAQPNNTNAIKHGYYSDRMTRGELDDITAALSLDLSDEISLTRVQIRRLLTYLDDNPPASLDHAIAALNAIAAANAKTAHLVRLQQTIAAANGNNDVDLATALTAALAELTPR